jgi:hypothetical protein
LPSLSDPVPPVSDLPTTQETVDVSLQAEPTSVQPESKLLTTEQIVHKSVPTEPASGSSASEMSTKENILDEPLPSEPDPAPPVSDMPIPEVIVEKVDEDPRYGDDFGPHATTGQKDAHEMRAQDAEPDHVVIQSQTTTPGFANTAAEVADSAAMLDREPSPAPVSDEEAGRTGERRMSNTPIPQVALTAAEVADIAMIIDADDEDGVGL